MSTQIEWGMLLRDLKWKAIGMGVKETDADDLAQEICRRIIEWELDSRFRSQDAVWPIAMKALTHGKIDAWRRKKRQPEMAFTGREAEIRSNELGPLEALIANEERDQFLGVVSSLSPKMAAFGVVYYIEQGDLDEIAARTQSPKKKVYRNKYDLQKALKRSRSTPRRGKIFHPLNISDKSREIIEIDAKKKGSGIEICVRLRSALVARDRDHMKLMRLPDNSEYLDDIWGLILRSTDEMGTAAPRDVFSFLGVICGALFNHLSEAAIWTEVMFEMEKDGEWRHVRTICDTQTSPVLFGDEWFDALKRKVASAIAADVKAHQTEIAKNAPPMRGAAIN